MAEASLVTPITPEHFEYDAFDPPPLAYPKLPPRVQIEGAIETLIAILDAADPDTDFEETGLEDGFHKPNEGYGPGCPIADPDFGAEEAGEPQEGC